MTPNNTDRKLLPETRTVRALRAGGWVCDNAVIKRGRFSGDYLGIIDVVAFRPGEVLLVQATSKPNVAARITKVIQHPNTPLALQAGARIEVWGWSKDKDEPRVEEITWDRIERSRTEPSSGAQQSG